MRIRLVSGLAVLLLIAGCSSSSDESPSSTFPTREATTTSLPVTTSADDAATTTIGVEPTDLALVEVAEVEAPIALATDPATGDLYAAERAGRVVSLDDGEAEPILDIRDQVDDNAFEQGLLGLAISPAGDSLYVDYTDENGDTQIDAYDFDAGVVDADSRRSVFSIEQPFANHNGGNLVFGPDGFLYVGLGDGGSGGDPRRAAQDPTNLLGKILRIDPEGGDPYAVPGDNPFTDGSAEPEIWLYGVRNPWRFSFDRATGDLWVADVGQDRIEEIDYLPVSDGLDAGRGANLGWSEMEGSSPYEDGTEPADHTGPIHEYANDGTRCSVTGGYVYRGSAIPSLEGAYVYGDFCESKLRYLRVADGTVESEGRLGLSVPRESLVSFGEDADGELYVLSMSEDRIYRIEPA